MHHEILTLTTLLTTALAIPSFSVRQESCQAQANDCRVQPGANQAYCSALYAACLGYNPYTGGSSPMATGAPPPIVTGTSPTPPSIDPAPYQNTTAIVTYGYSTSVVPSFYTYVTAPTVITYGSKTYTVTGPTTLTVTDCPCTLTVPVTSGATPIPVPPIVTGGGGGKPPVTTTAAPGKTTSPPSYVGAANMMEPAVGLVAMVMGAFALLM